MAFDAFIKLDGVEGECADDKHVGWISVLNYGFGASQPKASAAHDAGGAPSGRVDIQDFTFTKYLDKASPKLFEACCTGKAFPVVTVELCRAGGDKLKYMEYKLSFVMVHSMGRGGDAKGSDDVPIESVSLTFGKMEMTYTQQDPKTHAAKGNTSAGWDLQANKKI